MRDQGDRAPRVLLATDGSIAARATESWVTRAGWAERPEVEVLCVAGPAVTGPSWALPPAHVAAREALAALARDEEGAAQRIAEEVAGRLRSAGLSATALARAGEPAVRLLERVDEWHPSLVAIGSRGRSDLEVMVLGSVTQQVAAHCALPVLIARSAGMPPGRLPQRVLIVVDSGPAAGATVGWLSAHGWLRDARVTLLGLLGITSGLAARAEPAADELTSEIRRNARDTLGELVASVAREAAEASLELRFGHPLEVSLEMADQLGVDIVAVSRQARQPGQYPFAEKVARYASRSVLLGPVA
ncbi:MAG TPA: universal stress protein [Patescibacteria group bacterium]|nr:universal stress protein [Patescibacteria group bacterium]